MTAAAETDLDQAYRVLAARVLLQAWVDLQMGGELADDARAFLASAWAAWLIEGLGLNPELPAELARRQMVDLPADCLTVEQAAQRAEVTEGTIRDWVKSGKLGMLSTGYMAQTFISKRELDRLIAKRAA